MIIVDLRGIILTDNFVFPDSNDYKYPENEVGSIKSFSEKLDEIVFNSIKNSNEDILVDFVINYDYSKIPVNKLYSVYFLISMKNELEKNILELSTNEKVKAYIAANEHSLYFDDVNTWKKITTWIIMRKSKKENFGELFFNRRIKLLESIAANNTKFSPLTSYLIACIEYPKLCSKPKVIQKDILEYNEIIKKYPDSEFAAKIYTFILIKYIQAEDYDNAINTCKTIVTKYKNFYTGVSDLYFDTYVQMLEMYSNLKSNDNIKYFVDRLNKNSKGYNEITKFYSCLNYSERFH